MLEFLLEYILWNNSVLNYIYFIGIIIISFLVAKFVSFVFKKYLRSLAKKTETQIDNILAEAFEKPILFTLFFLGVYFAFRYLVLTPAFDNVINKIFTIITVVLITWGITKLIHSALEIYWMPKAKKSKTGVNTNLIPVIKSLVSWVIWAIALVFILSNIGLNVTSLVAGLGIGGLAIAFALQGVFADIFASISIYLDKPFHIGDYIVIGAHSGTVKKIGIKTTRIETLQGEELVVSNKELTETRIQNYKKMRKRRVAFKLGVEYGTSPKKLKNIPIIIKNIIDKVDKVDFDRAHFTGFGDFSLDFEIVMFIDTRDYTIYRDIQQKVNLGIVEAFAKKRIDMAFPTQTVFVKK